MAISGRLQETSLPSLLQVLSQSRKSGRLSVARGSSRGVVLLRAGKLIYAASSSVRETLGNVLVCEKLISEETLLQALERQHTSLEPVRLGEVLVEMGALSDNGLRKVLEEQTSKVLRELVLWQNGFFKFDSLSPSNDGLASFDLGEFLVTEGLRVDRLLLHLADLEATEERPAEGDPPPPEAGASSGALPGLREVADYLNQPVLNAEMTVALLRYASARVDRVLLFMVHEERLQGIAQAGVQIAGEQPDARIRNLKIPTDESSVFSQALELREAVSGTLDDRLVHRQLIEQLGDAEPTDTVVVPMVVQNQVAFILYGDVLEGRIENRDDLEVLMLQAGLSMEKAMLALRVETLEERLRRMPSEARATGSDLPASASIVSKLLSSDSD